MQVAAESDDSNPRAQRVQIAAWCLYDFANSPFTTLVVTFIYSAFFAKVIVGDEVRGAAIWTWALTISSIVAALAMPLVGAIVDRTRRCKLFFSVTVIGCILATTTLAIPKAGDIWLAWSLFVIANILYDAADALYNAFLPGLAPEKEIGRVSGYGWALGYLGGLVCLLPALGMVGLKSPAIGPWLSSEAGWNIRATNLLVAGWFLLFSVPAFLFVREPKHTLARSNHALHDGFRDLLNTLHQVRRYRNIFRFLIARLLYNNALVAVFGLAGLYAQAEFAMDFSELMLLGIWLNIVAGLGAFLLGRIDDRVGGRRMVIATLIVLLLATIGGGVARTKTEFWIAATFLGIMAGPNQSSSRAMLGRLVPEGNEGQFFGFYAFSGKATAWLGTFMFGTITWATGNLRFAVLSLALLFAVGLWLFWGVRDAETVESVDK